MDELQFAAWRQELDKVCNALSLLSSKDGCQLTRTTRIMSPNTTAGGGVRGAAGRQHSNHALSSLSCMLWQLRAEQPPSGRTSRQDAVQREAGGRQLLWPRGQSGAAGTRTPAMGMNRHCSWSAIVGGLKSLSMSVMVCSSEVRSDSEARRGLRGEVG